MACGFYLSFVCGMAMLLIAQEIRMVFTERTYHYVNTTATWPNAEQYCVNTYGTHLASWSTVEELQAIMATTTYIGQIWQGLNRPAAGGVWSFVSGDVDCLALSSQGCIGSNFSFWSAGEGYSATEHCGTIMTWPGKFPYVVNDADCTGHQWPFFCNGEEPRSYVYKHEGPISIAYNNKIDDVYVLDMLEISFDLQLLSACPDSSYPYCHIFKIGIASTDFPRLPLIYARANDARLRFLFSTYDSSPASRLTTVDSDLFNGDYHHVHLKYSPLQTMLIVDGTTFANDTLDASYAIDDTYLQQAYSVFVSDSIGGGGMSGNIKNLTITSWNEVNTTSVNTTTVNTSIVNTTSVNTTSVNIHDSAEVFLQNHKDTEQWWVAFYIQNLYALTCSFEVHDVQITDHIFYQNLWVVRQVGDLVDFWSFEHQGGEFSLPISVKIAAEVDGTTHAFFLCDIITNFTAYQRFPLNIDLCNTSTANDSLYDEYCNAMFETAPDDDDDDMHKHASFLSNILIRGVSFDEFLLILMCIIFAIFSLIAYMHAKRKKNDYFQISAFIGVYFQMMDVYTDILFCLTVSSVYFYMHGAADHHHADSLERMQYLLIFVGSVLCIVGPIIASLFQLYSASSKYWLYQSRTRLWLLSFDKLLYLASILTGSSFAAIDLFNSNLFGCHLFYMGVPNHFLLGFLSKKVYSVILMENVPQLLLSVWYTALVGHFQSVVAAQITFSLISIIVTVISLVLKRRIYRVEDSVHITISIKGADVVDEMEAHRNEISIFKKVLSRSILGVNERSVEIQKPYNGGHIDGVQLLIFISFIHEDFNANPAKHYEDLIQGAMDKNELQSIVKDQWQLSTLPDTDNIEIECYFVESKARQKGQVHFWNNDDEGQSGVPMTNVTSTSVDNSD